MLWRNRRPELRARPLHRAVLRRAAHRYADHRWDVVPGACLSGDRFDCGRPGCPTIACHPALPDWELAASHDPRRIADWWRRLHHGVLLATGRAFDVLELPASLGHRIADRVHGPIAVAPPGRWMVLVRAGDGLRPELARNAAVVLHRRGSWIPAPPTRLPAGRVQWLIAPDECEWRLPDPLAVQRCLIQALETEACAPMPWSRLDSAA